jgi:hypothetical protein
VKAKAEQEQNKRQRKTRLGQSEKAKQLVRAQNFKKMTKVRRTQAMKVVALNVVRSVRL